MLPLLITFMFMFCLDKLHVETALSTNPQMLLAFWEIVGRVESCDLSPAVPFIPVLSALPYSNSVFIFFPWLPRRNGMFLLAPFIHLDGILGRYFLGTVQMLKLRV